MMPNNQNDIYWYLTKIWFSKPFTKTAGFIRSSNIYAYVWEGKIKCLDYNLFILDENAVQSIVYMYIYGTRTKH